jgi:hypothetical protein
LHRAAQANGDDHVDKCIGCNFYDRQNGKQAETRGTQWGQCRRSAPMLHPINQKSYMIEGVWPHVRDDDWCGEWKAAARRTETRSPDLVSAGPLLPINGATPFGSRPAMTSSASGGSPFGSAAALGSMAASGRGD